MEGHEFKSVLLINACPVYNAYQLLKQLLLILLLALMTFHASVCLRVRDRSYDSCHAIDAYCFLQNKAPPRGIVLVRCQQMRTVLQLPHKTVC